MNATLVIFMVCTIWYDKFYGQTRLGYLVSPYILQVRLDYVLLEIRHGLSEGVTKNWINVL